MVCASLPMGCIKDELGTVIAIDGELPFGVFGEVRVHQAIYARRTDVHAICRIMPPVLMGLSTQSVVPRARHGIGAYLHPGPVFWDDPRLLRDATNSMKLAAKLAEHSAIVMRGNGAFVVSDSLQKAVTLSWFLEDSARIEHDIRSMGFDAAKGLLDGDEIRARQTFDGQVVERMWTWLTGDSDREN